ncbi:MAG TPA: sodium:solute symporter family protein [Kofleriaceae bacterium]|nr:sodium:solute symporter family protein [Kofleriaceae bacterium]
MNPVLAGILVYLTAQLALGFWIARRVRTEDDYLLAGRSLGYVLSTFTIFATWFGAETCIGSAGRAYSGGLSETTADPFGYAGAVLLFGLVFAAPLWRRKLTTLADLFRDRFGPGVERLGVLLMVPSSVMWAAAQIRAFGQVLGSASGLEIEVTITIAAAVVILYTTAGGLLADAWTDLVQGIVLIAGLVALLVVAIASGDAAALGDLEGSRLSFVAPGATLLSTLETWAPPVVGSLVAQELIARACAARAPEVARRAAVAASAGYLLIGGIPLVLGLIASRTLPGLAEPESALMQMAADGLPAILYVIFAGALVSAILSTVDSALLVSGSLLAHNLVVPLLRAPGERTRLRADRVAVVASGLAAYAMAFSSESIYELVVEASSFGTAGIFTITVFGLWSRLGGRASAYVALSLGVTIYAVGSRSGALDQPYLTALAGALVGYLAVSAFSRPAARRPAPAR